MRKIIVSALLFPVLIAMTIPAGSQTRPRRVNATTENLATPLTDARPRVARNDAASGLEQPRRAEAGKKNSWLKGLMGMGIAIGTSGLGRSSCSPSRHVFLERPRSGY